MKEFQVGGCIIFQTQF